VEAADGGGQRSSGEVVERKREQECGCARGNKRRMKFTGRVPKPKKRRVGRRQAAAGGRRRAWWLGQRTGLGKQRAEELGARWCRKSGEGAAGGRGKRRQ
jgi:hypothetical protein